MTEENTEEVKQKAPKAEKNEKPVAEVSQKSSEGSENKEAETSSQPTAADLLKSELGEVKVRRAKGSKNVASGICYILATFNNTKVTFTDERGNAISWSSAGKCNFRGSRKSTAYAAQIVTQDAGRKAMSHGMNKVQVEVKGPGMGRDPAVRALQSLGFDVTSIKDTTPIPHNGCREKKRRRV